MPFSATNITASYAIVKTKHSPWNLVTWQEMSSLAYKIFHQDLHSAMMDTNILIPTHFFQQAMSLGIPRTILHICYSHKDCSGLKNMINKNATKSTVKYLQKEMKIPVDGTSSCTPKTWAAGNNNTHINYPGIDKVLKNSTHW